MASQLEETDPSAYEQVASNDANKFLFFPPVRGFDGQKVAELPTDTPAFEKVQAAETFGKQQALKVTAMIPATMAVCYLLLILYFRAIGGYKLVEIGPGGVERETAHEPNAREAIYKDSAADQA
jgi:hypothetical protein